MSYDKSQQELWKYYDPNGTDPSDEFLRLLNQQEEIKTTIVDVQTEQTSLGNRVTANETNITQNANEISLQATEITSLDGRLATAESNITINADNIALKVSESDYNGDTIVGLINVSSAGVVIQGEHINLVGAVNVLSDITGNLGTITAGNINGVRLTSTSGSDQVIIDNGVVESSFGDSATHLSQNGLQWTPNGINYYAGIYFPDFETRIHGSNGIFLEDTTYMNGLELVNTAGTGISKSGNVVSLDTNYADGRYTRYIGDEIWFEISAGGNLNVYQNAAYIGTIDIP